MEISKLIVFLYCLIIVQCNRSKYCDICPDHTLCIYPVAKPSSECGRYDPSGLLTEENIEQIVNRVNEKRNLVADGRLSKFPVAANMKRVRWSTELATFAQRWADQCDTSVKPSREDQCRDLEDIQVGQTISTVLGPAPGLNVKNLVDTWIMLKLYYTDSVMYYNRSADDKANYFTQLIWADTEIMGCGKVKFYNQILNKTVERLICNFAPKGNILRKPIYTIGYPATQCANNYVPDHEYSALCKLDNTVKALKENSARSLLHSVQSELNPYNFREIQINTSDINNSKRQKTRNIYKNRLYGAKKRHSFHVSTLSGPENFKFPPFTPERGHSRLHYGYERNEPMQNFQSTQKDYGPEFSRFQLLTTPTYSNARRHYVAPAQGAGDGANIGMQCTRHSNCCTPSCATSVTNQCTRGQPCLQTAQSCHDAASPSSTPCGCCHQYNNNCTPCPTTPDSPCNTDCQSPTQECSNSQANVCPKRRADSGHDKSSNTNDYNYYDLFPNLGVRSNEDTYNRQKQFDARNTKDIMLTENVKKNNKEYNQVNDSGAYSRLNFGRSRDSFDMFYSSDRKRREFDDQVTFRPFWQMEEYNFNRLPEKKIMRYTTLKNILRKSTISSPLPTETITIKMDEHRIHENYNHNVTERYLSFEELMRLRKLSSYDESLFENMRRAPKIPAKTTKKATTKKVTVKKTTPKATTKTTAKTTVKTTVKPTPKKLLQTVAPTTTSKSTTTSKRSDATKTASTSVVTANTPFVRQKHCTRRLTCTWTVITGSGEGDGGNGIPDFGSRTPPGYVEGCSRTSTCTRDFMDRNKMASSTESGSADSLNPDNSGDDDYCEKRSLNVQRRDLDDIISVQRIVSPEIDKPMELKTRTSAFVSLFDNYQNNNKTSNVFDKNLRLKRGDAYESNKPAKASQSNLHQCSCNSSKLYRSKLYSVICLFLVSML